MILGTSRQPHRAAVAVAVALATAAFQLSLSSMAMATAFVFDTCSWRRHHHHHHHHPLTSSSISSHSPLPPYVLKSFNNDYLDFGITNTNNNEATAPASARPGPGPSSNNKNNRVPIVAGNWKLNPSTIQEASTLLNLLASNFIDHRNNNEVAAPEVIVFPPFPYLERAVSLLEGTGIKVGAQNVGIETKGAFTGEVSPSMVRSLGCDYVMVGHSERRTLYGETDELINAKIKLALEEDAGLRIILCVGETLEEYENELLPSVVNLQIKKALNGISKEDIAVNVAVGAMVESIRLVVAYEPVWAIGTGKVASPDQAQIAHAVVRNTLGELYGSDVAEKIQIQYGGSVTPDSISDLISMPDVDGALVGGASLTADGFTRIADGAAATAVSPSSYY